MHQGAINNVPKHLGSLYVFPKDLSTQLNKFIQLHNRLKH